MGVHPALPLSTYSYISLGFVLIPALTVGLAWMLRAKESLGKALGASLVLLTVAFVLLAQQGRTTYVTLTALVIFFILSQLKSTKRWLAMVILLAAGVTVGMFSSTVQKRINEVVVDSQVVKTETIASSGLRIGFWRTTLDIVKQHPILGTGMGTWADEYRKYVVSTPNTPKIAASGGNPHQEYLLMASQLGLTGLALFVTWLLRCAQASRQIALQERIAAQSLLVAFTVGCFFNSTLFDSATGHFFCIALGILFAGYRIDVQKKSDK
jgi:O-antigen ligase